MGGIVINDAKVPAPRTKRYEVIDIIRGFALLGVLIVNTNTINIASKIDIEAFAGRSLINTFSYFLIELLFSGKFITLFTFLFGLSFYMFTSNLEKKGLSSKKHFIMRLVILFLFGVLNYTFVWTGDILMTYALTGFLLIPISKLNKKAIIKIIIILLSIHVILQVAPVVISNTSEPEVIEELEIALEEYVEEYVEVYTSGEYSEMRSRRVSLLEIGAYLLDVIYSGFKNLAMFLLGLLCGRLKVVEDDERLILYAKYIIKRAFPIGVALVVGSLAMGYGRNLLVSRYFSHSMLDAVIVVFNELAHILIAFSYASFIVKIYSQKKQSFVGKVVANYGKMALSSYLIQCTVLSLIFFNHGLGITDLSSSQGLLLALGIFGLQLIFSNLWFVKFRQGPIEAIWRKATYGFFR